MRVVIARIDTGKFNSHMRKRRETQNGLELLAGGAHRSRHPEMTQQYPRISQPAKQEAQFFHKMRGTIHADDGPSAIERIRDAVRPASDHLRIEAVQ